MKHLNTRTGFLVVALPALLLAAGVFVLACGTQAQAAGESEESTRAFLNPIFWKNATASDVRELIERGADPKAKDAHFFGFTPLHMAMLRGDAKVVKVLLQAGADPEAKNEYDLTPLHYAAKNCWTKAAKLLLKAGANPEAMGKYGRTPRDFAEAGGKSCFVDVAKRCFRIAKLLRRAGG